MQQGMSVVREKKTYFNREVGVLLFQHMKIEKHYFIELAFTVRPQRPLIYHPPTPYRTGIPVVQRLDLDHLF
jgi:hypothetical protein